MMPTRLPSFASITARFTATVDLPTPPFPDEIAMTRPRLGYSAGLGGWGMPVDCGMAPPDGGPWVGAAEPAGSTTAIFTSVTPGIALRAARVSRTSVAGSDRPSRNVKVTRPSGKT